MTEARDKLKAAIDALGLRVTATFIPFSQSRNKGEKHLSLNWLVTLERKHGEAWRPILTTDYGAGVAHCPAYKLSVREAGGRDSIMREKMLRHECETGRTYKRFSVPGSPIRPILPDECDVIHALVSDASVLDYSNYESWADDMGYDEDSRKGEATYKLCLEIALKLRNGIGEAGLAALREAA